MGYKLQKLVDGEGKEPKTKDRAHKQVPVFIVCLNTQVFSEGMVAGGVLGFRFLQDEQRFYPKCSGCQNGTLSPEHFFM